MRKTPEQIEQEKQRKLAYQREYRKRMAEKGICPHCLKNPVVPGLRRCEPCRSYLRAHQDAYRKTDAGKEVAARSQRKATLKKYDLTEAEYDTMLGNQMGGCAICRKPPGKRRFAIDHDHATGRVRGLLCYACNYHLLGKWEKYILAAADYLKV